MKPSGIGGQAVIEGVMMKNKDQYAVAVRKPDNEIVVEINTFVSKAEKYKIFKLPIFRGMLVFVESMIIGTRILTFSASFFEEEEEMKQSKIDKAFSKIFKEKAESIIMSITIFVAILLAVGIFIVLPTFIANSLGGRIESETLTAIVEGCIRILIFISYIAAISLMKDIKRMFMYHGAEHKTINCLEQGFELTVENVKWQSRQHKRCGTSFMFIVMFVSILFFIFIRVDQGWLRYLTRILLVPIIAGVSYEFIRFAGKSDSKVVNILSQPGLWLQGLTTREPDETMIEVAIQSVEAVFDWKNFLEPDQEKQDNKSRSNKKKKKNSGKNYNPENKTRNSNSRNNSALKDKQTKTGNADVDKQETITENTDINDSNKNQGKNKNTDTNKKQAGNRSTGQEAVTAKTDIKDKKSGKNNRSKKRYRNTGIKQEILSDNEYITSVEETAAVENAVTLQNVVNGPVPPVMEEEDDEILRALDRYLGDAGENAGEER